jgi:cell wall-associated NlpC family hydrolase
MPARFPAILRRTVVAASSLMGLAMFGSLVAVSPAQASVEPVDRAPVVIGAPISPIAAPVPVKPVVAPATKVLAYAASLRGRPYVYGAAGPSSFDCSGYTRYVFAHSVGRSLVHSSASQYAGSVKIANSAIRPGDLVFYTSGGRVYHVGIYAGGGLMWDAPHTGAVVRLEKITTSSWVAGRVL